MQQNQYPDDWDERRRKVYSRDDYECQSCGAQGGSNGDTELHAHHKTPLSQGGSNDLSNLITLCKSCHNNQHAHDITADQTEKRPLFTWKGWVVSKLLPAFLTPLAYWILGSLLVLLTGRLGSVMMIVGLVAWAALGVAFSMFFTKQVLHGYLLWIGLIVLYEFTSGESLVNQILQEIPSGAGVESAVAAIAMVIVLVLVSLPFLLVVVTELVMSEKLEFIRNR